MARKLIKIFILLLVIALIAMGLIYYALFISINQIDIRYETLSSDKIPDAMNDVKIAYFTDLEYGNFVDEQRLDMPPRMSSFSAGTFLMIRAASWKRKISRPYRKNSKAWMPRWENLLFWENATVSMKPYVNK